MVSSLRVLTSCALLLVAVSIDSAFAQSGSGGADAFTFFATAQPDGVATPGYLRMHHPLYLLDLCRQVKSGALDREEVAPLVGGEAVLNALLARDLDALYEALTEPRDVNAPPTGSDWSRILSNLGAAPPPAVDLPAAVTFDRVGPRDAPSQVIRVTAPADGSLQASLPTDSPFRVLSMRSYDGLVFSLPRGRSAPAHFKVKTDDELRPRFARDQAPWTVPVVAGQDVDVEVGLPAGTSVPPGGLASTVTFSDPLNNLWSQGVSLTATPALPPDSLYVYVDFPKTGFVVIKPPSYPNGYQQAFLVPLTLANPSPPALVRGTVKLASGPQGLSMSDQNFTLGANGTLHLSLLIYVESGTPAWTNVNKSQPFRLQVDYHTVPLFAAGTTTPSYGSFIVYPGSQSWSAQGNAGPIDCEQFLSLYSTGTLILSSTCGNYNIVPGKASVFISLGATQVGATAFGLGPNERQWANWTISTASFQSNYLFWRTQPLIMKWQGCTLC